MIDELPDDDELLAAELAFGLLNDDERRAAEMRLDDPAIASAYARWQAYASTMVSGPGETPRPSVWSAIEARLPANDAPRPASARLPLRMWQAGTAVASAAAIVLAALALQKPEAIVVRVPVAQRAPSPMVAVLTGKKGFASVSFDRATGQLTSAAAGLDIGDHSTELWVIPADGKPRSLGVINATAPGRTRIPAVAAPAMTAGATIAVSVEPVGGSSTGLPTGPVILTGKLATT